MKEVFNVMNFIRCPYEALPKDNPDTYVMRPKPLKGTLFVSFDNLGFLSGQVRVRVGRFFGAIVMHFPPPAIVMHFQPSFSDAMGNSTDSRGASRQQRQ